MINQWPATSAGSARDNIKVIGLRHGEKMYETLLTKGECVKTIDW